jgi:hypothetical protein
MVVRVVALEAGLVRVPVRVHHAVVLVHVLVLRVLVLGRVVRVRVRVTVVRMLMRVGLGVRVVVRAHSAQV